MEEYLRKNYKNKTYKEMCFDLQVSESTIYRKIKELGLSKLSYSESEFIQKCIEIHGDKYDYSNVNYQNSIKKINIICKQHGIFTIRPGKHLLGQGCKKCGRESIAKKLSLNKEKFVNSASKKHGNKYDYSISELKSQYDKVKIICYRHGIFEQTAKEHIRGSQCPKCSKENNCGYSRSDWEKRASNKNIKLYYIKCWSDHEIFYKIGLTCKDTVEERFLSKYKMPYKYTIIKVLVGGIELYDLELLIKKKIIDSNSSYIPELKFGGSRYECFTENFRNIVESYLFV